MMRQQYQPVEKIIKNNFFTGISILSRKINITCTDNFFVKTKALRLCIVTALTTILIIGLNQFTYAQGWYNTGGTWLYRKAITIDFTKVPNTDQSGFPVLVNLTSDGGLSTNAMNNGFDILFTSGDGITKIPYEREGFTKATGALVAWVKATLSHSANTVIYMYYGNSVAGDQQDLTHVVWDANFKGVWHMKEATGTNLADATSTGWTETQSGSPTQTASQIGNGLNFNGTTQFVSHVNGTSPFRYSGAITYSFWANMPVGGGGNVMGVNCSGGQGFGGVSLFSTSLGFVWTPTAPGADHGINSPTLSLTAGQWAHIVVAIDITNKLRHFYVNGAEVSPTTINPNDAPSNWTPVTTYNGTLPDEIGGRSINSQTYFKGTLDEVRVSNSVRSADWVMTEYNNQRSPSTFYSLGAEDAFLPTITPGTISSICAGSTSFAIPYTTTGSPDQYSISGTGITTVTNQPLPLGALPITVNLSTPATTSPISFILTVRNSGRGAVSSNVNGSVTVNALPVATVTGQTNITCFAANNGTITVAGSGGAGTGTYTFSVDGDQPTPTWLPATGADLRLFTGLLPNHAYRIKIKDNNGCISK